MEADGGRPSGTQQVCPGSQQSVAAMWSCSLPPGAVGCGSPALTDGAGRGRGRRSQHSASLVVGSRSAEKVSLRRRSSVSARNLLARRPSLQHSDRTSKHMRAMRKVSDLTSTSNTHRQTSSATKSRPSLFSGPVRKHVIPCYPVPCRRGSHSIITFCPVA